MNTASRNERRKITATAVNNLAVALVVTGVIVPTVNLAGPAHLPTTGYAYAFALLWIAGGCVLHLAARHVLGRMEE